MKDNTINKLLLIGALCLFVLSTNTPLYRHHTLIFNDILSARSLGFLLFFALTVVITVFFWKGTKWAIYLTLAVAGLGFLYATFFGYIQGTPYDTLTVQRRYDQLMASGYFFTLLLFGLLGARLYRAKTKT